MDFLIQFLLPLFGVLTAILIATSINQMKILKKHEENEVQRHEVISNNHNQIFKEVEKVNKKIDSELIPSISNAFKKKSSNQYELSSEDIGNALKNIGYENHIVSSNGEFILVGMEDNEETDFLNDTFKSYFFIQPNIESKDLLIESHSFEFNEFNEDIALMILKLNDSFKVSSFSVANYGGRYVLKTQYLIDAPDGTFSARTLDFIMNAMFSVHQELIQMLNDKGIQLTFIEPHDLLILENESNIPNKAIKADT
ncbi:hypothetical protein [Shewanella aegiceratis]|uniref:hypothetical protein n=1 Tax=Shewanella aegiceratis TaxID=2864203 RepID=UPI001C65985B|nr:hypothetical protein [Shewanella aegiceratis]QYJ81807.1 hypothetical protein K0H80_16125 [Shewanella aegiceratis]